MTLSTAYVGDAILTQPEVDRYYVGSSAAPDLVLLGTDAYGCAWWTQEPEGWAAPEAVTPLDERQYGDGAYPGATTFAPRAVAFGAEQTGVCAAPDRASAAAALRRLIAVATSRTARTYVQEDAEGVWALSLRATGKPKIAWLDTTVFAFAFTMVAPDPFRYDPTELQLVRSTGLPSAVGGYRYPLRYPLRYGAGSAGQGSLTIVNRGDEDAQAIYRLTGPLQTPTVMVSTTGDFFTINRTWGATETVEVDTAAGTVLLNGTPIFDDLQGGFPTIPPGTSTVQWSHQGTYNADARLTVVTTSTRR